MSGFLAECGRMGRGFALLWAGETAFGLGAALMQFALGVWAYQQTGSAEQFSLVALAASIPALVCAPLAGALADRFDRRWVIVGTDAVFALSTLVLVALLFGDRLSIRHLYVFNAVAAGVGALRGPSYQAAICSVLTPDTLTRANGLIGLSRGTLQLAAPLIAGGLMARAGLKSVLLVEVIVVIAGSIAIFRAIYRTDGELQALSSVAPVSLWQGMVSGFLLAVSFFRREPLMAGLLVYKLLHDGLLVLVSVMSTPLILSTHSPATLGLVASCGAAGGLGGSLFLAVANSQKRLMVQILLFDVCLATCVLVLGLRASPVLWCSCAFLATFAGTGSDACSATLWMRKTPKDCQGSLFSLVGASGLVAVSAVLLVGGFLGEHVFEPALAAGGRWEGTVGAWMGAGKGRGLGLLFVLSGAAFAVASLGALAHSSLRRLDELVRDSPVFTGT